MKTRNNNGISVRLLVMILALTLIIGGIVGGSVAWLTAQTDSVVNTFTVGDINIELTETGMDNNRSKQFKMVPGNTIAKDPKVTVKANSEACWLFVKVEKSNNFDSFMTFTIADGWTKLTGVTGVDNVYYRQVDATSADATYSVLKNDQVAVNNTVTKSDMEGLTTTTYPTLTFTAYAVQLKSSNTTEFTAAEAWAKVNP